MQFCPLLQIRKVGSRPTMPSSQNHLGRDRSHQNPLHEPFFLSLIWCCFSFCDIKFKIVFNHLFTLFKHTHTHTKALAIYFLRAAQVSRSQTDLVFWYSFLATALYSSCKQFLTLESGISAVVSCYQVYSGEHTLIHDQFFSFIVGKHRKLPYERTASIKIPLNPYPPASLENKHCNR